MRTFVVEGVGEFLETKNHELLPRGMRELETDQEMPREHIGLRIMRYRTFLDDI